MLEFAVMALIAGTVAWRFQPTEPLAILGMALFVVVVAFLILRFLPAWKRDDETEGSSTGQKLVVAAGVAIVFLLCVIFLEP